jgi:phage terminase large subunit-like protein
VKIEQTIRGLSEPTKKLLELHLCRKLRHGNNPVLNFAASCLRTVADMNDNKKPAKPDRGNSGMRIDPIAAAITGFARAILLADQRVGVRAL